MECIEITFKKYIYDVFEYLTAKLIDTHGNSALFNFNAFTMSLFQIYVGGHMKKLPGYFNRKYCKK